MKKQRFKYSDAEIFSKINDLWHLIGNTPMVELHYSYKGKSNVIYAKCENYNLTGSLKDRMALYMFQKAYINAAILPNDLIIEATSGNSGISFSAIGKALGHEVKIIMPNWLSKERMDIIRNFGADVHLLSKEEGGFLGCIDLSKELASKGGVFLPSQFDNHYNSESHKMTTGREIALQLQSIGKVADAFIAGVGTGGTIMGVGSHLREINPKVQIHPLEPAESPTLSTGYRVGTHRIQGISDEFIPKNIKMNELDEVIQASDGDSIIMAQKLAAQLGLAVGISSGANIIGAIKLKEKLGKNSTVVTILCDDNKKYLSTDLVKYEPVQEYYMAPEVDFNDYLPINRLSQHVI